MPQEITDSDLELLDDAFAEAWVLSRQVREGTGGETWFRDLLGGLLDATVREYRHLRSGLRDSTAMLAWACRNLLELNIRAQWVLRSEANARHFANDRIAEGIEILDSFQAWAARNDPALMTPAMTAALNSLVEQRAQREEAPQRVWSVRYLSAEAGLADEYANMNKVCEKLIRPTAFSVLTDGGELAMLRPVLFRAGAGHGLEIVQAIKGRAPY